MRAILEEARKEHLKEVVLHISNSNPMEPFTIRAAVQYGSHRLLQALRFQEKELIPDYYKRLHCTAAYRMVYTI